MCFIFREITWPKTKTPLFNKSQVTPSCCNHRRTPRNSEPTPQVDRQQCCTARPVDRGYPRSFAPLDSPQTDIPTHGFKEVLWKKLFRMPSSRSPQPPPRFPQPQFSGAHVCREAGVGYLVVSHVSGRQFFVGESSPFVQTQFSGSVSKCYEVEPLVDSKASGSASKNSSSSRSGSGSRNSSRSSPGDADGGEDSDEEEEEQRVVMFEGRLLRYHPSRPMALKTCRISALKLEAQWQQRELGELSGEVRY